jgi:hypothetical protein
LAVESCCSENQYSPTPRGNGVLLDEKANHFFENLSAPCHSHCYVLQELEAFTCREEVDGQISSTVACPAECQWRELVEIQRCDVA